MINRFLWNLTFTSGQTRKSYFVTKGKNLARRAPEIITWSLGIRPPRKCGNHGNHS